MPCMGPAAACMGPAAAATPARPHTCTDAATRMASPSDSEGLHAMQPLAVSACLHEIDVIFKLHAIGTIPGLVESNAMLRDTRHALPAFAVHQNRTCGKQKKEDDSANNAR